MSALAVLRRRPAACQHQPFRRLLPAWVSTNLADSALYLSVAVWVKDLTGSDAAAAIVFAALGLANLTGPLMGHLVDRVSRRPVMIVANLVGAALVAALLLVTSASQLWLVYAVIFGYGTLNVLTATAQSGLLRDMLPDEHLASGNGLLSTIDQALRLVSPLLGTALYVALGPAAVVWVTVACFLLTALLLTRVHVRETPPEPSTDAFLRQAGAGFRHLAATSPLGAVTVLASAAFAATAMLNVAVFPVIEHGLQLPTASLGVLVSLQGVGAVVAGATAATVIGRRGEVWTLSAGLGLLALGAATLLSGSLALVLPGIAAVGFGVTWCVVAFVTLRQRLTPARMQGRTAAATMMALNLPQALLTLVGAALVAAIDYRLLIAGTVLVVLLSTVGGFVVGRRPVIVPAADSAPATP